VKFKLPALLALSLLSSFAYSAAPTPPLSSGITKENYDLSVRAQDDFFQHVHGTWLKKTAIPADQSSWGAFEILADDTLSQLRTLIEATANDTNRRDGSDTQKIGDFYASFMDEAKLEQLGLTPLQAELTRIAALTDKKDLPALCAHLDQIGVSYPFGVGVDQDAKDATRYAVFITQNGLGMPDRDYYLKTNDAKLNKIRAAYVKHVQAMLSLAGDKNAAIHAKDILAFETAIARIQWNNVENRDSVKTYNKTNLAKLAALSPHWNWDAYLSAARMKGKIDYVIVNQPSFLKSFDAILQKTDLDTWKAYLQWQLLRSYASFLSAKFVDTDFAFYGKVLEGVPEIQPRWKRGVEVTQGALGESIGKAYVAQHFPPERKARMETMVKNLLNAYQESIATLDWMSDATKLEAQDKLSKFLPKIAYPNQWRDYSTLKVLNGDLVNNVIQAREFVYNYQVAKLGQPINREEWGMTPQTVNAYYNPTMNEIVFPAAFLQPPFFDAGADDAANYGAIGSIIGHEISHGFDDEGSRFDGNGNLRDWWTPQDHKNFRAKTKMLIKQYNAFSPLKGYHVNGALTLGENIADNSGMAIAYKAYQISLAGKPAPVIDGLTGDQRFFMGFAQVWRSKTREPSLIGRLKADPHSPEEFRTNGTLRNSKEFYQAFEVKKGDKMYLAPKDRVVIW
jgi:predicted metalloendopeptidase